MVEEMQNNATLATFKSFPKHRASPDRRNANESVQDARTVWRAKEFNAGAGNSGDPRLWVALAFS